MTTIQTTTTEYPQPAAELIEDIQRRLAEIPPDIAQYINEALKREPIESVANYLWKAGHAVFISSELYEYRRTLFPPNALLDPYTSGPPSLLPGFADPSSPCPPCLRGESPPSPADPSPALQLLNDLRNLINRYVVLPPMAAETLALWIVHTYAFTLRQVTTYIGVLSPEKRCGKTTLLELLGNLAHEATPAANISPSALFRVIEATRPTLLIDEADTFLQGRDELCGILNAGYRKDNAYVIRVAESKSRKDTQPSTTATQLVRYSCWCPKVMAAIGRLPETLADRCIVITMQRKMPGEKCERLRDLDATPYRQRCAEFVEHHRDAIAAARPEIPSALNDRAADIWEPLLAIADLAGGDWPQLARQAAQQLSAQDDELTPIGYFLADLRTWIVLNKRDRVLSRDIVASFNPVHNRPWEELRRGRELNEWWLGRHMRQLGVRPRYIRVDDITGRGYLLDDIEAAFRRYVPKPDPTETSNANPQLNPRPSG